jgi:AcrR family transcriptional regulator
MEQDKSVRKPQQKRSIQTKEKILDTAYALFCKKGYYNTTTNEIAKVAGVSIGSLYSYFKDQDTIFIEILERYNESFSSVHDEMMNNIEMYRADKKAWLRNFIVKMIEVHESSKELNREMNILCYTKPKVAEIMEKQREKSWQAMFYYFSQYKDEIIVQDKDAAAVILFNLINSTVDQIVFEKNEIESDRIIDACVETAYKYLLL